MKFPNAIRIGPVSNQIPALLHHPSLSAWSIYMCLPLLSLALYTHVTISHFTYNSIFRYPALPRPLLDLSSSDPFHVGEHIKTYAGYHSKNTDRSRNALSADTKHSSISCDSDNLDRLIGMGIRATRNPPSYDLVPPPETTCQYSNQSDNNSNTRSWCTSSSQSESSVPPPLPPRDYHHGGRELSPEQVGVYLPPEAS